MADTLLPLAVRGLAFDAGGQRLLHGIDLDLRAGERLAVLGPNGAGKSLLLRLCHGLLAPTAGQVRWNARLPARRQAMVFQRPLMLRRSVLDNAALGLALDGMGRRERQALALRALRGVGLQHLAARPARVLSGGEQQRLALARAAALDPEVLFLDEVTSSLDPRATLAMEEGLQALHARGTTLMMVTHDLGQARRLATRVLLLVAGRVVEDAPASAFFTAPATPEAARFLRGELLV